jgi:carbon-monoxide dehydrogenase large subunit
VSSTLFGTSVVRVEDHHLLVGDTTYVANLDLPGVAEVRYVTATVAHGEILSVDVEAARRAPGVLDVVTAADLDVATLPGNPPNYPEGTARPVLCSDRVRFVGDPVVAIVAETAVAAADAVELVEIDYRPLPAVVDPREALQTETLLFPHLGTNVMTEASGGDDEPPDISACEVVVEAELVNQRLAPCPLETRVAASLWTEDGRLVHYASCQGVHPIQKGLCDYYGLDKADVRVLTSDVGGSFGAKARFYPEEILLPLLARRVGRPVRWVPWRSEDMVGLGHSRAQRQTVRIGGTRDGTLQAIDVHVLADCGAYPVAAPAMASNTGMILPGPFAMERAHWKVTSVATNTTPLAAYRGAGRPEAGALIDRAVDLFAAEVGMDQLEIRRRNLLRAEDLPWTNPTGLVYESGDYHEALEMVAAAVDYDGVKAEQARRRDAGDTKLLGIGLSTFIDRTAGIPGSEYGAVELKPDGGLRVLTGSSPYGQGHYTTWAMLVSERTGVPVEAIEVVHGDTDVVPRGSITGGSRSAQKAGSAVAEAADALVDRARDAAATLLEAAVEDVVLDTGAARFHVTGAPAVSVGWAEVAASEHDPGGGEGDGYAFKCESDFSGEGPTVPYGAYAAVVEVDADTGRVDLVRMVTVDDAGRLINPMIVLGQVHGGVGQAIAQALFEEFRYDEDGNPLTASFLDYYFPTAADLPDFECHLTQNPSPQNPLGMKGIAESGTIGGVPAVQNAVVDALAHLGVRHLDLPLSPQRVWSALHG